MRTEAIFSWEELAAVLVTMSKLPLSATSTEPASNPGSVTATMQSPSAGDAEPHFGLEKVDEEAPESAKQGSAKESLVEPPAEQELLSEPLPHDEDETDHIEEDSAKEEEAEEIKAVEVPPEEREEGDVESVEEIEEEDAKREELQREEDEVEEELPEEQIEERVEEEEVEEYEYTKEEVKYMKTAFAAYQKEKQEKKKAASARKKEAKEIKVTEIPISTLGSVLRSLGLNPTQEALKSYADWLDADPKDGVVKFDELLIIVGREKKVAIDESHVLEAFRSFDVENNQLIPIETLQQLLVLSGERFSPEEWIIFVHLADPKNTAFVDYENFVARMGPNPPAPQKKKKGKKKGKGKSK